MLQIAKIQLISEFQNMRYIIMFLLIIAGFLINGLVSVDLHRQELADWQHANRVISDDLDSRKDNLQLVANCLQTVVRPPSEFFFITESTGDRLPDSWQVNAFVFQSPQKQKRANIYLQVSRNMDWEFIIGTLLSIMCITISYDAVCGEKRNGTMRLLFSNRLTRLQFFLGKYFGLLSAVCIALLAGMLVNLAILTANGTFTPSTSNVFTLLIVFLLAVLYASLTILVAMAVSSLVHSPVISLVILLVYWLTTVTIIPGIARPVGEYARPVPSDFQMQDRIDKVLTEYDEGASEDALTQYDDPFDPKVAVRSAHAQGRMQIQRELADRALADKIGQVDYIETISLVSPAYLLRNGLRISCGTGVPGFRILTGKVRDYQQQLHAYTVAMDRRDPDSPHHVYSWGEHSDRGVFSRKPVSLDQLPQWQSLWNARGTSPATDLPWLHLVLFIGANLNVAIVALLALYRYDLR